MTKQRKEVIQEDRDEHFTTHAGDLIIEQMGRAVLTSRGRWIYWLAISPDGAFATGRMETCESTRAEKYVIGVVRSMAGRLETITVNALWAGEKS